MTQDVKIEEIKNEGLLQEFKVSCPAEPVTEKTDNELKEKQKTFKMAGFREGKVPLNIVRKRIGSEVMAKVIEKEVDERLKVIFEEKSIRPALQPNVEIKAFDPKAELEFTVKVEIFPDVPSVDWDKVELETLKITTTDEDLKKAHDDIVKNFKNFNDAADDVKAKKGDTVIIDFVGTVDEKEFEGGTGSEIRLELGSGQFIPGFEDQLIDTKKGDKVEVKVTFPENYGSKDLAGKDAVFATEVKKVMTPEDVSDIDDEFAKKLGVESLEKLNELIQQKIEADFQGLSRLRTKKILFDKIDSEYKFPIPDGMLRLDFKAMWNEIKTQKEKNPEQFKDKTDADLEIEYKEIAARRVRLGILLAETAKENNIDVSDEDLQKAIQVEAMQRPGQEQLVVDFYKKRENLERLKGPLLEEKAVDFILTKVKTKDKEVTSKDFFDNYAKDLEAAA